MQNKIILCRSLLQGEARGRLTEMQDASSEFSNLLNICGKLISKKKEKLEKIEQHLEKYGYTPYRASKSKGIFAFIHMNFFSGTSCQCHWMILYFYWYHIFRHTGL
jgi:hypothetical protein